MNTVEEDERDPRLLFTGQSRFGWHRYETFMQCPRKYAYKYVEGGSEERRALSLGTHIHLGLAHYYKHLQAKQRQEDCDLYDPLEAIRKSAPPSAEVALAQKIVAAYIQNYTFEKVEVLHVEEVFELDFNGAPLTSRVDLVIRSKGTGKVHVCDHKCLPGDAMVWTTEGDVAIRDLVEKEAQVAAVTNEKKLVAAWAKKAVAAGVQDVYEIRLANGIVARLGYRHPVLTPSGWVQAKNIDIGDCIGVPLDLPAGRDLVGINDAFLRVLGQIISDSAMKDDSLRWTKTDPGKRAKFIADITALGGIPSETAGFVNGKGVTKAPVVRIRGRALRDLLEKWRIPRVNSPDRFIPDYLISLLSARQIGQVLGGLWSGDGHAGVAGNGRTRICFSGRSKKLCYNVHRMLLRLGIPASISESSVLYKGERRPTWTTTVIGAFGKTKFLELVESGFIPVQLDTAPLYASMNITGNIGKGLGYVEGSIWWVPVVENTLVGQEECFDLEVPEHHTFVAENLITHNTAGQITRNHAKSYSASGQFLTFRAIGTGVWGDQSGGPILNMIQTDPVKFERPAMSPMLLMQRYFPLTIQRTYANILALEGQHPEMYPRHPSEHTCMTRYGLCPFYDKCEGRS